MIDERPEFFPCYCDIHNGQYIPEYEFGTAYNKNRGKRYRKTKCKVASNIYSSTHKYPHLVHRGRVRRDSLVKYLWEISYRVGGLNKAADTIGISRATIYRLLNRYKGYEDQRTVHRATAYKVIVTLRKLRTGDIPSTYEPVTRWFRYGCKSCGIDLDEKTPGCDGCYTRHDKRKRR